MTKETTHPVEIELKLALSEAAFDACGKHEAFLAVNGDVQHQVTTYFDTVNHQLAAHGIAIRVRRGPKGRVQTVKTKGKAGVASARGEWEWPIDTDEPDLGLLHSVPAAHDLPQRLLDNLQPLFTSDIRRHARLLRLSDGSLVEAALDHGTISAGKAKTPVRELELELREGRPNGLYRLAIDLHAVIPMTILTESKAARGYRLLTGEQIPAQKFEAPDIDPKASQGGAFKSLIEAGLGQVLANQEPVQRQDAEGLHQMRVAIRRLRSVMVLFKPYLEPVAAKRFDAELRRVGRVLGEARDWDVFIEEILPEALADDTADWAQSLILEAEKRRAAAYEAVYTELQGRAFTGLILGLAAWVESEAPIGPWANPSDAGIVLSHAIPDLLDQLAKKVARRGQDIDDLDAEELHSLRKALKKLRYAIDDMRPGFDADVVKPYRKHCKDLQELLGTLNDATTATGLASSLSKGDRADLAPAIGALGRHLAVEHESARQRLTAAWAAFSDTSPFWH